MDSTLRASPTPSPAGDPSARGGPTVWSRAPFGTSNQRCLACEGHGDAHCRPGEDSSGSTPVGSALSTHGNQPIVTRADPHHAYSPDRHGTCPKVQVRLAAAGCLHTAVALELAAGQARAAESDSDARRPRGPVFATAERAAGANPASNLKSPSVAFGTRRPTRTTTRSNPRWIGRLLRAGLESQSPGYRRPAAGRTKAPTYAPAPPRPRPAYAADSAGGPRRSRGETPARAMARHTMPDIAARQGPAERKRTWIAKAGRRV